MEVSWNSFVYVMFKSIFYEFNLNSDSVSSDLKQYDMK